MKRSLAITALLLCGACKMDVPVFVPVDGPSPDLGRLDLDGDGYTEEEGDCDDLEAEVGPDKTDICDGLDNDCDGESDGSGVCERRDVFIQTSVLDLLFVVDRNDSRWRARVVESVPQIVRELVEPSARVHIGVISTDEADEGRLISYDGAPEFASNAMGAAIGTWLSDQISQPGTSHVPRPLDALVQSWTISRTSDSANEQFFREDAHLAVVILSERQDRSNLAAEDVLDSLRSFRGDLRMVTVDTIGLIPGMECDPSKSNSVSEPALLADLTGGNVLHSCIDDPAPFLSASAQTATTESLEDRFTLPFRANPESLRVAVTTTNGRYVTPEESLALGDQGRSVIFLETPPPPGSMITVRYLLDY